MLGQVSTPTQAVLYAKHFVIRRKGAGQSIADKKVTGDNSPLSPQAIFNDSYTSATVLTSTPLKRATTIHDPSCLSPRKRLRFVDAQTQSSPAVKSAYDASIKDCLQKPSAAPLNYEEEKLVTHFVRCKLNTSSDKLTVRCKTGGQPLILRKNQEIEETVERCLISIGEEGNKTIRSD